MPAKDKAIPLYVSLPNQTPFPHREAAFFCVVFLCRCRRDGHGLARDFLNVPFGRGSRDPAQSFFSHDYPPHSGGRVAPWPMRALKPAQLEESPMRQFVRPLAAALSIACLSAGIVI